jgi:hypothetical protein
MCFRIGIHLGDVIAGGDDVFGDGVNVAARLQQLVEPGGICNSGAVYDQLGGGVDVRFEDMGEQHVASLFANSQPVISSGTVQNEHEIRFSDVLRQDHSGGTSRRAPIGRQTSAEAVGSIGRLEAGKHWEVFRVQRRKPEPMVLSGRCDDCVGNVDRMTGAVEAHEDPATLADLLNDWQALNQLTKLSNIPLLALTSGARIKLQ